MLLRILILPVLMALLSACSTTESLIVLDDQGRVIKKTDKATGTVTEWQYDSQGRISTIRTRECLVKHSYDATGRLIKIEKQPDGIVCEFEYTDDGKLKAFKDPDGNITMYVYGKDGKLKEKILPDGTKELAPNPPTDPMSLVPPGKYEYDKPARPEQIQNNMSSTVNTYTIPGQYRK